MHGKIAVSDLWKGYPTPKGFLSVLEGIDFTVPQGEFVALVGPSGCGKTTLLNIIAGFERPNRGKVTVDGVSSGQAEPERYRDLPTGLGFSVAHGSRKFDVRPRWTSQA